LAQEKLDDTVF